MLEVAVIRSPSLFVPCETARDAGARKETFYKGKREEHHFMKHTLFFYFPSLRVKIDKRLLEARGHDLTSKSKDLVCKAFHIRIIFLINEITICFLHFEVFGARKIGQTRFPLKLHCTPIFYRAQALLIKKPSGQNRHVAFFLGLADEMFSSVCYSSSKNRCPFCDLAVQ